MFVADVAEVVQNQRAGTKDLAGPTQTFNPNKQNNKRGQIHKSDNYLNMTPELPWYQTFGHKCSKLSKDEENLKPNKSLYM